MEPDWLRWARELQAIAQTGLHWARDPYDRQRYEQVRSIASQVLEANSDLDGGQVAELFSADEGYATPKVDVRGVVICEERVLLVREHSEGRWTLPGGWADVTDSPAEAVVREMREEAGLETVATKLLACFDRSRHGHPPSLFRIYKLFFRCEAAGEHAAPLGVETDAVGYFDEHDLPPLSMASVTPDQLRRMFEHHRNPHLPTDFD